HASSRWLASLHYILSCCPTPSSFLFHAPATTDTYTLSLHDALPICSGSGGGSWAVCSRAHTRVPPRPRGRRRLRAPRRRCPPSGRRSAAPPRASRGSLPPPAHVP